MLRNVGDEMNSSLVPIQWKSSLLSATERHSIFRWRQLGAQEAHLLSCRLVPPPVMVARTLLQVLWIVVVFNLVCVGLDAIQTDFQCKYACSSSQQGY